MTIIQKTRSKVGQKFLEIVHSREGDDLESNVRELKKMLTCVDQSESGYAPLFLRFLKLLNEWKEQEPTISETLDTVWSSWKVTRYICKEMMGSKSSGMFCNKEVGDPKHQRVSEIMVPSTGAMKS